MEHITTDAGFDALQDDWQHLASRSRAASVFNGWHWNRLWWQHYGDLGELCIVVVRINNTVRMIAPFYVCRTRMFRIWPVKTLKFIGTGGDTSPDDLDVLYDQPFQAVTLSAVAQSILRSLPELARISLADVPAQSPLLDELTTSDAANGWSSPRLWKTQRRVQQLPDSLETYLAGLSRNARKHWRRRTKALSATEGFHFSRCTSAQEVDDTFDELVSLHRSRHATKGKTDSFNSHRYLQFHRTLMHRLLQSDELWLVKLQLNQRTVGVEYAYLCNGELAFFQAGFDPEYQSVSPGHQLMMHMIEHAIATGVTSIDLLKGDYDYKNSYTRQWRTTVSIDWWRSSVVTMLYRHARTLKRWWTRAATAMTRWRRRREQ